MVDASSTFTIQVEVDATNAQRSYANFTSALRGATSGVDSEINKIEKGITGTAAAADKAATATRGWSQSLGSVYKTQMEAATSTTRGWSQSLASVHAAQLKAAEATMAQKAAVDNSNGSLRVATGLATRLGTVQQEAAIKTSFANKQVGSSFGEIEKGAVGAAGATQRLTQNLSTTRYALYDVSSTLAVGGAVMLGLAVATTAVAVAWERDFAQVVRTTGVVGDAVGELRGNLVDLAQTMPVAFGDLAQIATLGGQLGVAEDRVASFTGTVAKFSAVTDLTVSAAATAFGRLDALLPDVQGNYEALGSAIALVGVNSVATESQIVNTAVQISAMGVFAGLTADQVVGLAGALASVGVAPELARGTTTRLFTEMSQAVSEGGAELDKFAQVSGVSSERFASAFGTSKFGPIFQSFIEGLADTTRNGGDAVAMLDELGIKSVRDVPALLRLAGAGQLLGDSFDDAAEGFGNASELNRQYGIISETTAAKLQVFVNNFNALLDAIGSANLGPLRAVIDGLSGFLGFLTDIASTDLGGGILGAVVVLTALLGVLGLAAGAMALFGASTIGMQQALNGLVATAPRAAAAILGAGTASAIASGEMKAATLATKLLGTALKALSLIGLVLIIPDLSEGFQKMVNSVTGASTEIDDRIEDLKSSLTGLGSTMGLTNDVGATLGKAFADMGLPATELNRKIKELDDEIAGMAEGGNADGAREKLREVSRALQEAGIGSSQLKILFGDAITAIEKTGPAADIASGGIGGFEDHLAEVAAEAEMAEQQINELRDAVLTFGESTISVEQSQIALSRAFNAMTEAAAAEGATLAGTDAASLALRDSFIDIDKAARDAALAIVENGGKTEEATAKYMESREAIIQARIAKGEDEATARVWADTVLGTSAEAQAAIAAYSGEVNKVPATKNTSLTNNASTAILAVDEYRRAIFDIPGRRETIIDQVWRQTGAPLAEVRAAYPRASGGPIYGPGTGTSDDVPIMASNGEFMMRTAAVQKYGQAFMYAVNSGRFPKFAQGGSIGGSSPSSNPGGVATGGVVELGPKSLARLSTAVTNNIMLDDEAISRASQRGDQKRRSSGDL